MTCGNERSSLQEWATTPVRMGPAVSCFDSNVRALMPSIRIDAGAHLRGFEREVMIAINRATFETLQVTAAVNDVIIHCHDAEARITPEGRSDRFCLIEIKMLAGRSDDQKRQLRGLFCQVLAGFGVAESDVKMISIDIPRSNTGH